MEIQQQQTVLVREQREMCAGRRTEEKRIRYVHVCARRSAALKNRPWTNHRTLRPAIVHRGDSLTHEMRPGLGSAGAKQGQRFDR